MKKNPNQVSLSLPPEYRIKAYELAKRLGLMNPKHPNEPSMSELFRYLIDKEMENTNE